MKSRATERMLLLEAENEWLMRLLHNIYPLLCEREIQLWEDGEAVRPWKEVRLRVYAVLREWVKR